jgi:Phage integrase family
MAAVANLDDTLVRTGLLLLRATGMRIGELLDLELDCLLDFAGHGTWLRVPVGKLNSERIVPLDPDTVQVLDAWLAQRGRQRALPHPRDGRLTEFLFLERGCRPTSFRLRKGLLDAVAAAELRSRAGQLLHVTPHQLRHTFGTSLINGGIGLPALMALMGHVTPEMTLRYAKLATPTIRSAYQAAMDKVRAGQLLPLTAVNAAPPIPDKVAWLHAEMLKTRLAHGFCARPKAAGPCPYANICEQCDFSSPTQQASRRSARNSTTSAPCRPTHKPAAGPMKPPDTSVSRPASINTSNDYAATPRPTCLLDSAHEGRLMACL